MYCVHCGADGAAAFCAVCGKRQEAHLSDAQESAATAEVVIEAVMHWTETICYQTVVRDPDARERIAASSRGAGRPITGDDLLAIFDAVSPIGISAVGLTNAILPIYDKLGIRTGREAEAVFHARPGRVLLACLCALAAKSLVIAEVEQDFGKCSFTAEIPFGLITNRGKLHVLLDEGDGFVKVRLVTAIMGQWYDWGKSARLIDEILTFIHTDLTAQQAGHTMTDHRAA